MKKFSSAAASLAALLIAGGCAALPPAPKGGELSGTLWKPNASPRLAYVEFTDDDRMVGCAGTNRFFGPVSYAKGKRIRLGPLAATRMPPGPNAKYEEQFFSAMENTRGYVLEDDKLTFYSEERQPLMVLTPLGRQTGR